MDNLEKLETYLESLVEHYSEKELETDNTDLQKEHFFARRTMCEEILSKIYVLSIVNKKK